MDLMMTVRYLDELAALGVTIPDAAVNARNVYEEALKAASRQPSNDLRAALEAGDVNPGNVAEMVYQAASDLSAQQHAHAIVADLNLTLNRIIRQALRDNQDRIVADLRGAFEPAAEAVAKAAAHFGPGTTADEVISAPPVVIKAWKELSTHSRTLEAVSAAYRGLLSDVMRALPEELVSLFVTGTVDLHQAGELYRDRDRWLALAHAGIKLRLNDTTEAAAVVAQAEQVKAQQAEAERQQQIKANRFAHRFDLARG